MGNGALLNREGWIADPRVKELLDKGAIIGKISPMYSFGAKTNMETGETEEFSGILARVAIELGEKNWAAEVDLTEGEVVRLVEVTSGEYYKVPSGAEGKVEYFKGSRIEPVEDVEEPVLRVNIEKDGIEKNCEVELVKP